MRAGKRNDCFPNSYTGDPLVNYRRVVRTAGWPSWNLYLDSGPQPSEAELEAMQLSLAPPKDPAEDASEEESEDLSTDDPEADVDDEDEADAEASAGAPA